MIQPQQQVPGIGTNSGPGFCKVGGIPYLAWNDGNNNILWAKATTAEPDANGVYAWSNQQQVPSVGSSAGPAIASFNGCLHMAWKGQGNDADIYYSSLVNNIWTPQIKIGGSSSHAPAMTSTDKNLFIVWKGADINDTRIFWAHSTDGKAWNANQDNIKVGNSIFQTSSTPALTAHGSALYMAWKGGSHSNIYWSKCADGTTWEEQKMVANYETSTGPAITDDGNGVIWLSWKGGNNQNIYYAKLINESKNEWIKQEERYNVGTSNRPALISTAKGGAGIMMAWKGMNDDKGIYYSALLTPPIVCNFSLQNFKINNLRSGWEDGTPWGHKTTDTNHVSFSLSINGNKPNVLYAFMGDCDGGKTYDTVAKGLAFPNIKINDSDLIAISYYIVNKGGDPSKVVEYVNGVTTTLLKAYFDAVKALTGIDLTTTAEQGAFLGAELGTAVVPVIGTAIGALAGWLVGTFWNDIFWPNCDGPVAIAIHKFSGAQLRKILNSNPQFTQTENHPGVNSNDGCGNNSNYDVTWSVGSVN